MVIPGCVTVTSSLFASPDPGSTVTVPPAPAAVQASESVWKCVPSTGKVIGTTNTLAGSALVSRYSRDSRDRARINEGLPEELCSKRFHQIMKVPQKAPWKYNAAVAMVLDDLVRVCAFHQRHHDGSFSAALTKSD